MPTSKSSSPTAPGAPAPAPAPSGAAAIHHRYDPKGLHRAEAVYSTAFSSLLGLHNLNRYIHSIPALSYPLEFIIFLFGYAFNPVSIPFWMIITTMTGASPIFPIDNINHGDDQRLLQIQQMASQDDNNNNPILPLDLFSLRMMFPPIFYFTTVIITLIGTEICKFSFRATRPEGILSMEFRNSKLRRFRQLVASLKSKHSFPSGDSAQAANAVLVWFYYISPYLVLKLQQQQQHLDLLLLMGHVFAFGFFYPGVAFARIFYHCHWIEDCLAGAVLATLLHKTIIPTVSYFVWQGVQQYTTTK